MTENLTRELEDVRKELFDQTSIDERKKSYSKIKLYFPDKLIKLFYYYAMSYELGNNNKKAELFEDIMKFCYGNKFRKLGTGTNRVAFRRGMFVYKIALDRRGLTCRYALVKPIELLETLKKDNRTMISFVK